MLSSFLIPIELKAKKIAEVPLLHEITYLVLRDYKMSIKSAKMSNTNQKILETLSSYILIQ